jgi:hypothetical protein
LSFVVYFLVVGNLLCRRIHTGCCATTPMRRLGLAYRGAWNLHNIPANDRLQLSMADLVGGPATVELSLLPRLVQVIVNHVDAPQPKPDFNACELATAATAAAPPSTTPHHTSDLFWLGAGAWSSPIGFRSMGGCIRL